MSRRGLRFVVSWAMAALLVVGLAGTAIAGDDDSITRPIPGTGHGGTPSLQLDASGIPIVSHRVEGVNNLGLLACNDTLCAGMDESTNVPDVQTFSVGFGSSLQLNQSGNPVVAYMDSTNNGVRVLVCDDRTCDGVGESITNPVTGLGVFTSGVSMQLDSSDRPVMAYFQGSTEDLRVLVCNDVLCSGSDESINSPDPSGNDVGVFASLALTSDDRPVVSYFDDTLNALKVVVCNDPLCAGGDETVIVADDPAGELVGFNTSLALDSNDHPVVAYYDVLNGNLKLFTCDDPLCAGGGETITTPDATGTVGQQGMSLALNGDNPVVAYVQDDPLGDNLRLLVCDDPTCDGTGEVLATPDTAGNAGNNASLQLNGGNPVVAYYDQGNTDLRLLVCNDPLCADAPADTTGPVATIDEAAGQADPTNSLPVTFSVTFDEPVTGFTVDDVTLSGTASPSGASVSGSGADYTVSIDSVASDGTVVLSVADGAVLDAAANPSTSTVVDDTVTVDTTAPVVTVPTSPLTATAASGTTSVAVDFTATADEGTPTCAPASGSDFPVGTTTVTCSATDAAGNVGSASFDVVVDEAPAPDDGGSGEPEPTEPADTEPPVFEDGATDDQTIDDVEEGDPVDFVEPTATDDSGAVDVVCDPASGSVLDAGANDVTCTATDAAGNSATVQFTVTVLSAEIAAAGAPASRLATAALLLLAAGALLVRRFGTVA